MITQPKTEKYRTIAPQQFLNFPDDVDPLKLEVYKYLQGERADQCKGLTIHNFSSVTFLKQSNNINNGKQFIHALAKINRNDESVVVVLKESTGKPKTKNTGEYKVIHTLKVGEWDMDSKPVT